MAFTKSWQRLALLVVVALCFVHTVQGASASAEGTAPAASSAAAEGDYNGNKYFAVPAFFVTLREAIEACVIVSILLKFLDKVGKPELKRDVWIGAGLGLLIAIIVGAGFITAFYVAEKNFFTGNVEYIFEGVLMVFASIVITVLAMSMLRINRFREMWERKLQARLDAAAAQGSGLRHSTMFWLPFISVLREGIETVIFLAGAGAGYPASSIPIPGIIGLVVGFAIGYALYAAGSVTNLNTFLAISTVFLMFIAAGLFAHGAHEFQEANAFGEYKNDDGEPGSVWHEPVWDICDCCPNDNDGWAILRALVYYTCNPTPVEIFAYLLYWFVAIPYCAFKARMCCFKQIAMKGADESSSDKVPFTIGDDSKFVGGHQAPIATAKPV